MKATRKEAYKLMHEGSIALADVESNGIKIDTEYCQTTDGELTKRIKKIQTKLDKTDLVKKWRKLYGKSFKWGGNDQIANVLFNHMGYEPINTTKTGLPSTDEESLLALDLPAIKGVIKLRKFTKTRNTYIRGIMKETVDGILHPVFKLNSVISYRSSSSNPNFQNMPIRDPEQGELIRRALIARPGHRLMEVDYSGIEVRIAACYHKDPTMIEYINDPSKDMHRDMAAECYKTSIDQVTKPTRHCGKNMFVFPQFYGDYFGNCAKALWGAVPSLSLVDGGSMGNHMKEAGIGSYKRFTRHLESVEDSFWNDRFPVYTSWKEKWYKQYLKKGYFDSKTGFRYSGLMGKNDVINYPVQGAAFHCLLRSLIRINKELHKRGLKSMIVGQIHDSIVLDVLDKELGIVLEICRRIMCDELVREWKWIIVPIEIDAEITPVGGSWFEKKELTKEELDELIKNV